jgi:type II secretory pathway pseudopilin PulG
MSSRAGFTLVETLVAGLVGVALIVSLGVLVGSLVRHRANADSNSAATNLAQMEMERLRSVPNPDTNPLLAPGTYGWYSVTETNLSAPGGPYQIRWIIEDNVPALPDQMLSKQITVNVRHVNNPYVTSELVTYYQVAQATQP